jgi:hypothetical protein
LLNNPCSLSYVVLKVEPVSCKALASLVSPEMPGHSLDPRSFGDKYRSACQLVPDAGAGEIHHPVLLALLIGICLINVKVKHIGVIGVFAKR